MMRRWQKEEWGLQGDLEAGAPQQLTLGPMWLGVHVTGSPGLRG